MGTQTPAQQLFSQIQKLINSSRYNESFLLLKKNMQTYPALQKDLERIKGNERTYRYMLDYIMEGHDEPSYNEVMEQLRDSLMQGNDALFRESKLKESSDLYSSTKRMFSLRQTTFQYLLDEYNKILEENLVNYPQEKNIVSASQAKALNELFNFVWTMYGSEQSEYESLSKSLEDSNLPEFFKSLMVSAIILGNLSYFDPNSYEILLNRFDNSESTYERARAITGIVLIGMKYPQRVAGNLKLRSRLMLMSEDEDFKNLIKEVIINIIRTYDTQRIDNKMRNEVIPGLMKIKPEIIDKMRNMSSESENFLSDANPAWEELIENSDIGDKLREINDMQMEGADVMVTAFSNLKGFPFFYSVSNWFLPFTPTHYEFASLPIQRDKEMVERLTTVMCDSDLHSFLLSMSTMPEDRRNMVLTNMQNQMKEAYEAMQNAIGETEAQRLSKKIRHSLQDLYRFFKFFKKKDDFNDPFSSPFIISDIEPLMNIMGITSEDLQLVAEFYFKNKYYEEALGFFEMIDKNNPGNFNLWEKIGFSYDRLHKYQAASEWYKKAELVNPGNPWIEKKLAIALKNSGNQTEALKYYEKALEKDPENYHLLMSAGQCLLSCEKPKEALKHFYHAQYLKPAKKDTQRAIAWAELVSGNFEKAKTQYEKLVENPDADKADFLNAAHAALASRDMKSAVGLYKTFVSKSDKQGVTALVLAFKDDNEELKKLGIKTSDLRLIVDKVRYDLSE